MLRYAPRLHEKIRKKSQFFFFFNFKKICWKFSVKICFNFFLAIIVSRLIWSMLAKIWGGLGPLVWEEIENEQTVHKPKLKFIYRCEMCYFHIAEKLVMVFTHAWCPNYKSWVAKPRMICNLGTTILHTRGAEAPQVWKNHYPLCSYMEVTLQLFSI
jgi:hypothetical protein